LAALCSNDIERRETSNVTYFVREIVPFVTHRRPRRVGG
jgi:hypothetical protein